VILLVRILIDSKLNVLKDLLIVKECIMGYLDFCKVSNPKIRAIVGRRHLLSTSKNFFIRLERILAPIALIFLIAIKW